MYKNVMKMILVVVAGLMLAQCSTYKIKSDMSKDNALNKTPKWYVKFDHETMFKYVETGTAVSPDLELAVKKAILLAKAKLVDRINGEVNNRTTINKNEAGTNEDLNVSAGAQDIVVNVIEDTLGSMDGVAWDPRAGTLTTGPGPALDALTALVKANVGIRQEFSGERGLAQARRI